MDKLKTSLIILLGVLGFSACEKDDICIDADTPRLVIRFYDANDTTEVKDVSNLVVRGLLPSGAQDTIANAALDSIVLPLRVDSPTTSFTLERRTDIVNIDTITFDYEIREIYKSRACGYIVNYDSLSAGIIQDDSVWIQETRITIPLVENTASAHVKIFH